MIHFTTGSMNGQVSNDCLPTQKRIYFFFFNARRHKRFHFVYDIGATDLDKISDELMNKDLRTYVMCIITVSGVSAVKQ